MISPRPETPPRLGVVPLSSCPKVRPVLRRQSGHAIAAALVLAASAWCTPGLLPAAQAQGLAHAADLTAWSSLSAAQKQALEPLRGKWEDIDADQQAKWVDIADRFGRMSPADRERVQQRMADWARMSPAERSRARVQFQESRQLTPQERQSRWEAYQALPEEARRELANPARPAANERRGGDEASTQKQTTVRSIDTPQAVPVAPSVVRGGPGATTRLVTERPQPPAHQQTGLPKMPAIPEFVDGNTLLPRRGPQGAATVAPAAPVRASDARAR